MFQFLKVISLSIPVFTHHLLSPVNFYSFGAIKGTTYPTLQDLYLADNSYLTMWANSNTPPYTYIIYV